MIAACSGFTENTSRATLANDARAAAVSRLPISNVTGSSAKARVPSFHAAPRSTLIDALVMPAAASRLNGSGSAASTGPVIFSVARARVGIGPTNWPQAEAQRVDVHRLRRSSCTARPGS